MGDLSFCATMRIIRYYIKRLMLVGRINKIIIILLLCIGSCYAQAEVAQTSGLLKITPQVALPIGIKIWFNECGGSISGLTSWNENESYASLGIGHFIWYPYPGRGSAEDGFPRLIKYMESRGIVVPTWIRANGGTYCPWRNRTEFLRAQYSSQMIELRDFLRATIAIQAEYMSYHLEEMLPRLLKTVNAEQRFYVYQNFYNVACTPNGIYALVDYLNFKGDGANNISQHSIRGSGLLQILTGMSYAPRELNPLQAFVWSAKNALTRRVANGPSTSHENKWLAGWFKRLNTYLVTDMVSHEVARNDLPNNNLPRKFVMRNVETNTVVTKNSSVAPIYFSKAIRENKPPELILHHPQTKTHMAQNNNATTMKF